MILKAAFDKLFKIREEAGRSRAGADTDAGFDPYEKPFLDHLEDLRVTLMKMVGVLLVFTIAAFVFNEQIFKFALYPVQKAGLANVVEFLTLSPQEIFILSIKVAFFAGIILAFPFLVYFAGEFILPGLKQQEKKYVIPGVGVGFLLFLTGASFAFFVAVPIAMKFFYDYQQERLEITNPSLLEEPQTLKVDEVLDKMETIEIGDLEADKNADSAVENLPTVVVDPALKEQVVSVMREVITTPVDSQFEVAFDDENSRFIFSDKPLNKTPYRIGEYINLVTRMTLVFGLSFQLPVVVVILVKLELLTARTMRSTRAYAWVIMLVASAIMTPPDVFTLGLLAGPLIFLYEICIVIAWFMERTREKREREEELEREERYARLRSKPADALSEQEREELHKKEIEKYESEHAGIYEEDSSHVPLDPHQGGDVHDESWKEDQEYWHDHYHDHPHDYDGDHDSHHTGDEENASPTAAIESDHAEPTDADVPNDDIDEDNCAPSGSIVDFNTADLEELMTLPGIGPKLAQAILDHRPFGTFDEVLAVPGMGDEKLNRIMDRLSLGDGEE